ncbi:S66 family peptidase [Saccharibacillus alkalitolerans]|uniref:LD-carboxypeptidase n=1 Tax=Saccharibacillus alkalitolerans TaxID=2705290 RepID=A0ABX0FBG6_9BACL|nr:S66 peptidase family protein [Saccharibacillus alkalitolerans]NGZ75372.1 LD-carboxypeptidase [Saccharibacillus alkalitolerans]
MIRYPFLKEGTTIGVTAPSSGLEPELHDMLRQAIRRMEEEGFYVSGGDTIWTQHKAKSAPAPLRAEELNRMLQDENIGLVLPPWGGELLIEVLEHIEYDRIGEKWILGYSDISLLLLAVTLRTGLATAHGTNLIDLRSGTPDETTAKWREALTTPPGGVIEQHASALHQVKWKHQLDEAEREGLGEDVFNLTEPTIWRSVSGGDVGMKGRLLGGCVDVIRHLIGTPYGDVRAFREAHIPGEPVLWFLENCELNTADLRRSLVQMKLAGWFENCSGLMFGRSPANTPVGGYTAEDVYRDMAEELGVPVLHDIDCGHMPPQLTLINGAMAEVEFSEEQGTGTVRQTLK